MSTPDTVKLNDALQAVIQQLDEATTAQALRKADWTTAAAQGDDKTADKLEAEMEKAARVLQRMEVQRDALINQMDDAAEEERATHAAPLTHCWLSRWRSSADLNPLPPLCLLPLMR